MKKIFFLAALISLFGKANAQTPMWVWAQQTGDSTDDGGNSVAEDRYGNIVITGTYSSTSDFDPGPGIYNLTNSGVFISKRDSSGNFIWAKKLEMSGYYFAASIVDTSTNEIYTTGFFTDSGDFDPDPINTYMLTSNGSFDIFVCKLDSAGNFLWAKNIGGPGNDRASSLALDPNDSKHLYITGSFSDTVDFDPGNGVSNLLSFGHGDQFVLKVDHWGQFDWAKAFHGTYDFWGNQDIKLDGAGNIYTTGTFEGTVDFNPDPSAAYDLTPAGFVDISITKLDNNGNFIWAKKIGGTGADGVNDLVIDHDANLYITGGFDDAADFDADSLGTFILTAASFNNDVFAAKYDSSGNFQWAKRMGSTSEDHGSAICLDETAGSVYIAGVYTGSVDFDPGPGSFHLNSPNVDFILNLNLSGNFVWAKAVGSAFSLYTHDNINSMTVNSSGSLYAIGTYTAQNILFDTYNLTNPFNCYGYYGNIFLAKLGGLMNTGYDEAENLENDIFIYPNPAANYLNIYFPGRDKNEVTIYNISGQIIYTAADILSQMQINLKEYPEGIYFARIRGADFVGTEKFIVVK